MPNVISYTVDYKSDFGGSYEEMSFKIDRGIIERTNLENYYAIKDGNTVSCGRAKYLSMRKLRILFSDNQSVELPVPELDMMQVIAATALGAADVVCVTLMGERWKAIPPGILGGTYATDGIDGVDKPKKESGSYQYQLDGINTPIVLRTNFEIEPTIINTAQKSCINFLTGNDALACGATAGITPRRFIGERINTATEGRIKRQIPVASGDESEIKNCGRSVMPTFNCLGYEGQSIPNVADYYSR